jgi:hypothetical protein
MAKVKMKVEKFARMSEVVIIGFAQSRQKIIEKEHERRKG